MKWITNSLQRGLLCFFFFGVLLTLNSGCAGFIENVEKDVAEINMNVKKVGKDTSTGLTIIKDVVQDLGLLSKEGNARLNKIYNENNEGKAAIDNRYAEEKKHREKQSGVLDLILYVIGIIGAIVGVKEMKLVQGVGAMAKVILNRKGKGKS